MALGQCVPNWGGGKQKLHQFNNKKRSLDLVKYETFMFHPLVSLKPEQNSFFYNSVFEIQYSREQGRIENGGLCDQC